MNNIYLEHHGVKGQKWGIRKKDGSLTAKGKRYKHYAKTAGVFMSAGTGALLLNRAVTGKWQSTKSIGTTVVNVLLAGALASTLYGSIKDPEK